MIKQLWRNKVIKGNVNALIGNVIQAGFGLLLFLFLVRHLTPYQFGQWVIFITVATLMDMLRLGLTGTAVIRLISTSDNEERPSAIGASYQLSLLSTLMVSALFLLSYALFNAIQPQVEYLFILLLYPLLSFTNLPFHQANVVAQGFMDFKRSTVLKTINSTTNLLVMVVYIYLSSQIIIDRLIILYILTNALTSSIAVFNGWDGLSYLRKGTAKMRKQIMQFGKYATAGYIGSNLLKSADTFILTLAPLLGPEAVAIYSIPLKFVEFVEIPLRSFSSAAFPHLSEAIKQGSKGFIQKLSSYTVFTTVMLLPIVIVLLLFPQFFIQIIAGPEYLSFLNTQVSILYIVCVYILILPSDRYTGVALFAMNQPKQNFYKISAMLIANIMMDLVAVFIFQSIVYVAFATLIFTVIGVFIGWYYISQSISINYKIQHLNFIALIRKTADGNSA